MDDILLIESLRNCMEYRACSKCIRGDDRPMDCKRNLLHQAADRLEQLLQEREKKGTAKIQEVNHG